MRAIVLASSLATLAACSLVLSYDGISGGGGGADSSVDDAPRESTVNVVPDGGDAAPRVSVCTRAPKPTFCDDFDTTELPGWSIGYDEVRLDISAP
jgi:hypothetical protein